MLLKSILKLIAVPFATSNCGEGVLVWKCENSAAWHGDAGVGHRVGLQQFWHLSRRQAGDCSCAQGAGCRNQFPGHGRRTWERARGKPGPLASGGTVEEAAAFGEVLLISVPYRALAALGQGLRATLTGKIVLDACNPYPPDPAPLIREVESEGVALVSTRLLSGVRLVRAFSAVDATAIEASAAGRGQRLAVPIASDDQEALQVAEQLVRDAGCDPDG
jgi:hypothetical protein